jgi:hypothetical protein
LAIGLLAEKADANRRNDSCTFVRGQIACLSVLDCPLNRSKAGAANGPRFPVPIDREVCEGGTVDGVKQFRIGVQIREHRLSLRRCLGGSIRCRNVHSNRARFCGSVALGAALVEARPSPQLARDLDRVDAGLLPPSPLIADPVNLAVMCPAQGRGEFVADLAAQCTRLHEAQVMGI